MTLCEHVYKETVIGDCPSCGKPSHTMDWKKQNRLMQEWKEANPNAEYEGWMSI